jgi:tetratricopeptide (TPR) repeat protein
MRKAKETDSLVDRRRARGLAGDLDNIILKTLSKQPEQRYASVEALAQDLRRYMDGQPVQARAQSLGYRTRKYLRRHAVGLGLGFAVTSVLAVALAIVSWQASRAVKEASRAQAMQDFVIALFQNSGNASSTRGVDVRALLDAGVARADTELAAQPQARAELLGLIARLRSGLGDDTEALALLDRQQQLLQPLGGSAPKSLLLDAAALRGYSLRMLGRERDCLSELQSTLPTAQAAAGAAPLPVAEFLSQLGRCHEALDARTVARDLFSRALQLRRAHADADAGSLVAESEIDLARLAPPGKRLSALRKALAQLRASGGEQNALGVEIWHHLGATYEELQNTLEAEAAYRQSLDIALARFGANHPRTSDAQQELAAVLLGAGKLAEAERLLGLAQDSVQARWGPDSPQLAEQEGMRGMVALERDEPVESERLLTDSVRIWRARNEIEAHAADLCHLAQAQNELGRDEQADGNRRECLEALRGKAHPDPRSAVAALVHAAHAALDRRDLVEARTWLAQLPVPQPDTPAVRLVFARIAQIEGDATASTQLEKLLVDLPTDRGARRLRWQAQAMLAAQACTDGRVGEGLALRATTLAEVERTEPEHARQRRRLAFLSSACESRVAQRAKPTVF